MHAKIIVLIFCVSAVLAYPAEQYDAFEEVPLDEEPNQSDLEFIRAKRQFNLQGGGSPRQGFDLSANARFPIWQSQNARNSLDGTGSYSQHLGGPYGNSRPNFGGGLIFTHRF